MSKNVRFAEEQISIPPVLETLSGSLEKALKEENPVDSTHETPKEKEILDAYLIDNDETRQRLLNLLKMDCSESQKLYLVENYIEDHCPWVDLDYMESMWDYLGVGKYDSSSGRCVFFDKIPYASIYEYPEEKDLICDRIRRNKRFILSLKK